MEPADISFEECLGLKQKHVFEFPAIRVFEGRTAYLSKKARDVLEVHPHDQFAAAPNPDADRPEFFMCKTTDGRGWVFSVSDDQSGGNFAGAMVKRLGEEFEEPRLYELEETGMIHPDWETPIFLATPHDE